MKNCVNCICSVDAHSESGCANCRCEWPASETGKYEKRNSCNECVFFEKRELKVDGLTTLVTDEGVRSVSRIRKGDILSHCSKGYWKAWHIEGIARLPQFGPGKPNSSFMNLEASLCADFTRAPGIPTCDTPGCGDSAKFRRGDWGFCWTHTRSWDKEARETRLEGSR